MSLNEGIVRQIVSEEVNKAISEKLSKHKKIINSALTADVEKKIGLPPKVKKYIMHLRETDTALKIAFEREGTSRDYWTMPAGAVYNEDDIDLSEIEFIYVLCTAAKTLEIIAWW